MKATQSRHEASQKSTQNSQTKQINLLERYGYHATSWKFTSNSMRIILHIEYHWIRILVVIALSCLPIILVSCSLPTFFSICSPYPVINCSVNSLFLLHIPHLSFPSLSFSHRDIPIKKWNTWSIKNGRQQPCVANVVQWLLKGFGEWEQLIYLKLMSRVFDQIYCIVHIFVLFFNSIGFTFFPFSHANYRYYD